MTAKNQMGEYGIFVDKNADRFVGELRDFCRQPAICARGIGISESVDFLIWRLAAIGAETRVIEAGGPPVVCAEVGSGPRTLLFYNHYDVQPPDPLDLWVSHPFDAEVRENAIFARGVADNKGDLMARIVAIEAYQQSVGPLPLKIKFVVEGEEEAGSSHLKEFTRNHAELVRADGCVWEGGTRDILGRVVISLGMKGIVFLELRARGAQSDMHSAWGSIVPNPAWRLVWALSTLKDPSDRITVDGLVDLVAEPDEQELQLLQKIPFEETKLKRDLRIPRFVRDLAGFGLLRKHVFDPTCTICGFRSGYTDEGAKTVLPSEAVARLDFRLVPNLTPDKVLERVRAHLTKRGFDDVEVVALHGEPPAKSPLGAPIVRTAIDVARDVFDHEPIVQPLAIGSGPMHSLCQSQGVPAVSVGGVTHAGSAIHAPNENVRIADYIQGIKFIGHLIPRFAET